MAAEILVVDDESDIRELVGGILQDEGFAVRTAGNSADALAHVRTRAPRLLGVSVVDFGSWDGLFGWNCVASAGAGAYTACGSYVGT